jgi:hypothetical protein
VCYMYVLKELSCKFLRKLRDVPSPNMTTVCKCVRSLRVLCFHHSQKENMQKTHANFIHIRQQ